MRPAALSLLLLGCAAYPRYGREDEQYIPVGDCLWGDCDQPELTPTTPDLLGDWAGELTGGSRDFSILLTIAEETETGFLGEVAFTDANDNSGVDDAVEGITTDSGLRVEFDLSGRLSSTGRLLFTEIGRDALVGNGLIGAVSGDVTLTPAD